MTTSNLPNIFAPDSPMTRAHAAAMIGKAIGLKGDVTTTRFADVPSNHFAAGYINEAVQREILFGYKDGSFRPNETLTRGEMALMISRAFGYKSGTTTAAAHELMDKGISKGTGNGNFGVGELMKRGDFAVFLARAINAEFRVNGEALTATSMYVTPDTLNFRQGPSTSYIEAKKLFIGYPVNAYYKVGDWVYIKVDQSYGFVHSAYLSTKQPSVSSIKDPVDLLPETGTPSNPGNNTGGKKPLNQLMVIVDPGHGAHDPGGSGFGLQEKNVVLDMSLRLKKYFNQTPINVKLTRETDVFLSLAQRVNFARANQGDLFISIHTNAFNGSANGLETYYYGAATNPYVKNSQALSNYIQNRALQAWNLSNRGSKHGNFHVLRENTMPAVLVEAGFIDNKKDNAYIASPTHRESMARAIFLGTLDYLYHYEGRTDVASLYTKFNARPSAK